MDKRPERKPTVSIIIPVYNAEKWIEECLVSALGQTLKRLEIICINDGSTDNSLRIITEIAAKDPRIVLASCPNRGAASARNLAMQMAKGEFVTFLDADDYYPNSKALEKMYNAARRQDVLVCGGLRLWDFEGVIKPHPLHRDFISKSPSGFLMPFDLFQHDYQYQSYIYNRELLVNHSISFPDYIRYEDPVFFVKALVAAKEFYVIPHDVYCYRKKPATPLSCQAVIDTIKGITDNLVISSNEGLGTLHLTCLDRLNGEYYEATIGALESKRFLEVYDALIVADKAIDIQLLQKNGFRSERMKLRSLGLAKTVWRDCPKWKKAAMMICARGLRCTLTMALKDRVSTY